MPSKPRLAGQQAPVRPRLLLTVAVGDGRAPHLHGEHRRLVELEPRLEVVVQRGGAADRIRCKPEGRPPGSEEANHRTERTWLMGGSHWPGSTGVTVTTVPNGHGLN